MATNKAQFVYVTYIASTPEKVFNALMDPELTKQYWGLHRNVSDWKVGSRLKTLLESGKPMMMTTRRWGGQSA